MAFPLRSYCSGAVVPSKLLRTHPVRFAHVPAGELISIDRIFPRLVVHAKLDRIKLQLIRERIHGALHRKSADRFPGARA
jgi:hypothetical protein